MNKERLLNWIAENYVFFKWRKSTGDVAFTGKLGNDYVGVTRYDEVNSNGTVLGKVDGLFLKVKACSERQKTNLDEEASGKILERLQTTVSRLAK